MRYIPPVLLTAFLVFSMWVSAVQTTAQESPELTTTPSHTPTLEPTVTPTKTTVERVASFRGHVTDIHRGVLGATVVVQRVDDGEWEPHEYVTDSDGYYETPYSYGVSNLYPNSDTHKVWHLWAEYGDWKSDAVTETLSISPSDSSGIYYYRRVHDFEMEAEHRHSYLPLVAGN